MYIDINDPNVLMLIVKYLLLILIPFTLIFGVGTLITHKIVDKTDTVISLLVIVYYVFAYTVFHLSDIIEFTRVFGIFSSSIMIVSVIIHTTIMWAFGVSNKVNLIALLLIVFTIGVVGVPTIWVK